MNNIQSWSAFVEKVQNNNDSSTTLEGHNGVDSLYVSKKSENVAPAAVALLRQAGLTSSSSLNASNDNNNSDVDAVESEEEFRLRFHWMRPHPSLVFSLEEEMTLKKKQDEECQPRQTIDHDKHRKSSVSLKKPAPAVISARMMQVYRDAQVEQHEKQMDEDGENEVIMLEEEPNHSQSDNMKDQGSNNGFVNSTALLPFEHPELRVDLPSLVVPPLMTSWLPSAESIDTSYRDEQR